jgi:uncharacterized protein
MTPRSRRVITAPRFRTSEASALLQADHSSKSIYVGAHRRQAAGTWAYLGKSIEQCGGSSVLDYDVWCDIGFPHVIGVFGTRGSGKSFDLGVLAESVNGVAGTAIGEALRTSTIIFDVQNQFWTLALEPNSDLGEDHVQINALASWGLRPGAVHDVVNFLPSGCETALPDTVRFRIAPDQLVAEDWLNLLELDRYSAVGQALLALLREVGQGTPSALVGAIPSSQAIRAFQQQTVDALTWRLQALVETDIVGTPGIQIDHLLQAGKTSVIMLRDVPESIRALIVGVVVRLVAASMSRHHQRARIARRIAAVSAASGLPDRIWIVLDEAHTVLPSDGHTAATGPLVDYVKRGRDAGLSLLFATQQPAAVDSRLMSQIDMSITHALGFESDLNAALARMPTRSGLSYEKSGFPLNGMPDVIRALDAGEAAVADAASGRLFLLRVRPRTSAHGGNTPLR